MKSTATFDSTLHTVPRRYRLQALPDVPWGMENSSPSTVLAIVIEKARQAIAQGKDPDEALKDLFIKTLAQLIQEAMGTDKLNTVKERAGDGDPAFQAMVLRHQVAEVKEFASLSEHIDQDRRKIHSAVNAIAHPGKQQHIQPGWLRDAMSELHASVFGSSSFTPSATTTVTSTSASTHTPTSASAAKFPPTSTPKSKSKSKSKPKSKSESESTATWSALAVTVRRLLTMQQIGNEPQFEQGLSQLLDSPELERLQYLEALESDRFVRQYQRLRDKQGPPSGNDTAIAQGSASQQRGAAVEARAAQVLHALARRLNQEGEQEGHLEQTRVAPYRVVTSMRVPASLSGSTKHAKTEWDVVLLRQANTSDPAPVWDVCLFVEAKASAEAASTDFPKLLRGLRLLIDAEEDVVYPFETEEGAVHVRGDSLRALSTDEAALKRTILYCCGAFSDASVRLLNAANRMRLLSAPASVEFASKLVQDQQPDPEGLESVWHQLLESPQLKPVLKQYPTLRQVRELMVHPDDLLGAINEIAGS